MGEGITAVVAIVVNNEYVLVGKKTEASESFLKGRWHLPGETIEGKESDLDALIRGIREEAGIDLQAVRYLATSHPKEDVEVRWYECLPSSITCTPGSDLIDVCWVKKEEVSVFCSPESVSVWPEEVRNYFLE
ncbi:hypothetical protein CMO92_00740 [Candidatus Woesearchaeota archaeon]|nr:hypothetical protein [Candidatus Woesearchaeota archaeon]|tara:strand:- start:3516 stop:3914 length:399 start_codon:yes stop_codon:yes gene_type:complete